MRVHTYHFFSRLDSKYLLLFAYAIIRTRRMRRRWIKITATITWQKKTTQNKIVDKRNRKYVRQQSIDHTNSPLNPINAYRHSYTSSNFCHCFITHFSCCVYTNKIARYNTLRNFVSRLPTHKICIKLKNNQCVRFVCVFFFSFLTSLKIRLSTCE